MPVDRLPRLIAVSGKKRRGKGAVASILTARFGYVEDAFAAPLKAATRLIYGWTEEHTDGALKEVVDPRWERTPRWVLQTFGTQAGREILDKDLWVKSFRFRTEDFMAKDSGNRVVVSDCRFPNEVDVIRALGGQVWRIERPGIPPTEFDNHPSETALDVYTGWDQVIINDGSLSDLEEKVVNVMDGAARGT